MNYVPQDMSAREPVRRVAEIEEPTNLYLIHPLSALLVKVFAKLGVSPNAVSVIGMVCGILAGVAYHSYHHTWCVLAGFALMLAWHVMDGADGQLARLTGKQSELGKVLDGICDYVTFTAVYVGLASALAHTHGGWVWALAIISGLCHAVQSATYEMRRQDYNAWALGRKSAALPDLAALRLKRQSKNFWQALPDILLEGYTRVQIFAAGGAVEFHAALASYLKLHPAQDGAFRRLYAEIFAPAVRRWAVMSANYRTIGIFLCALFGVPMLYFFVEIFGLSLVLALLLIRQREDYRAFLDRASI